MTDDVRRTWISRGLAAAATVSAAVALVGLTTGAWATCTVLGLSTARGADTADPSRRLDVDLFPDGRTTAHGEASMLRAYDDGEHAAARDALTHAIPGLLDGFANACVVVLGLLAIAGIARRLPPSLWAVAAAVAVGALTTTMVLRFEILAALAAYGPHLGAEHHVSGTALAGRTTAALVVYLVAAAAFTLPQLRDPDGTF